MTPVTQTLRMELTSPAGLPPVLHAVQGDRASRRVRLELYSGGVPYAPPEGASATIGWRRADGSAGAYDAIALPEGGSRPATAIEGNALTVELDWRVCARAGDVALNLALTGPDGARLHTWELVCQVAPGAAAQADDPSLPNEGASEAADRAEAAAREAAQTLDASTKQSEQTLANAQQQASQTLAAANQHASQTLARSEQAMAGYLDGTKNYYEQVRTVTLGAQGWFATGAELQAARPTGENGWWAIVGETDTLWTWDGDTARWRDTAIGDLHARQVPYDPATPLAGAPDVQAALDALFAQTLTWLTVRTDRGYPVDVIVTGTGGGLTATAQPQDGACRFLLPRGSWTVTATRGEKTAQQTVEAETIAGQITVDLRLWAATLAVSTLSGAVVTAAADGGEEAPGTATAGADGVALLTVRQAGRYTVQAEYAGAASSTAAVDVAQEGGRYEAAVAFRRLTVEVEPGSTVTAAQGEVTLTAEADASGQATLYPPSAGSWTVTAALDHLTARTSVDCPEYADYAAALVYTRVFGVCWDYANPSTQLARLTYADDPQGVVNMDITAEPVAAVGDGPGSSPFDAYAPWNGMEEYNVIDNALGPKQGEAGFARTNDTVVKIPAYYYKVVDDAEGQKRYYYIADGPVEGFALHPGAGRYLARYASGAGYVSRTGEKPLVSITRAAARAGTAAKGSGWSQYDYAAWCAVQLLYLVEYADWDSQTVIGKGLSSLSSSSQIAASGATDAMVYHTGRAAGEDGKTGVQYRHLENLWGNVNQLVDGCNLNNAVVLICLDPAQFADDTEEGYTAIGEKKNGDGYIKYAGYSEVAPWAFYATDTGGSATTYIPDQNYYNSGWKVLHTGGHYSNTTVCGLFRFNAGTSSTSKESTLGCRLLYDERRATQ